MTTKVFKLAICAVLVSASVSQVANAGPAPTMIEPAQKKTESESNAPRLLEVNTPETKFLSVHGVTVLRKDADKVDAYIKTKLDSLLVKQQTPEAGKVPPKAQAVPQAVPHMIPAVHHEYNVPAPYAVPEKQTVSAPQLLKRERLIPQQLINGTPVILASNVAVTPVQVPVADVVESPVPHAYHEDMADSSVPRKPSVAVPEVGIVPPKANKAPDATPYKVPAVEQRAPRAPRLLEVNQPEMVTPQHTDRVQLSPESQLVQSPNMQAWHEDDADSRVPAVPVVAVPVAGKVPPKASKAPDATPYKVPAVEQRAPQAPRLLEVNQPDMVAPQHTDSVQLSPEPQLVQSPNMQAWHEDDAHVSKHEPFVTEHSLTPVAQKQPALAIAVNDESAVPTRVEQVAPATAKRVTPERPVIAATLDLTTKPGMAVYEQQHHMIPGILTGELPSNTPARGGAPTGMMSKSGAVSIVAGKNAGTGVGVTYTDADFDAVANEAGQGRIEAGRALAQIGDTNIKVDKNTADIKTLGQNVSGQMQSVKSSIVALSDAAQKDVDRLGNVAYTNKNDIAGVKSDVNAIADKVQKTETVLVQTHDALGQERRDRVNADKVVSDAVAANTRSVAKETANRQLAVKDIHTELDIHYAATDRRIDGAYDEAGKNTRAIQTTQKFVDVTHAQAVTNQIAIAGLNSRAADTDARIAEGKAEQAKTNVNVAAHSAQLVDHENRLGELESSTSGKFGQLKSQVENNRKRASAGIAGVAAMANIPQVTNTQNFSVGAGAGTTDGESAVAVGFSARATENVVLKSSVSTTTQHNFVAGAGISYGW